MCTALELAAAFFLPAAVITLLRLPDFIEAVIERIHPDGKNDND